MPDCDYCEESFESKQSYHKHLNASHKGELSAIDQRRVGDVETEQSDNIGMIVIGVLVAISFAIVIYLGFFAGAGAGEDGEPFGTTHEHGTIEIAIDGEPLDLHSPEFAEQDPDFHFHNNPSYELGDGLFVWHTHSHGVTLEYALETLGFDVAADGSQLTFDGETYDTDDPATELTIEVNGESVDPAEHEIDGFRGVPEGPGPGDDIRIDVTTE